MKVSDPKRVTRAYTGPERRASAVTAARPATRALEDQASVMGIPEVEFTSRVQTAVTTLMEEIDTLKQELERTHQRVEELETMADEDPLVPVLNRRAFERELARSMAFVRRYGQEASLIYFDLNDFKQINDEHGHGAGDAVLRHVGDLLSANVRQSDIVGRLGGDEFGVVLVQAAPDVAARKAAGLVALIRETPLEYEGKTIVLSVSAGAASLAAAKEEAAVIAEADAAMYRDKAGNGERETPRDDPAPQIDVRR